MSARTGGYILLQIMFDLANPAGQADRVLNGPTSDVWIDPWVELLRERGVELHLCHPVHTIYIDSPWALTSISQPQFWQDRFQPERLGDGRAHGILSVDVSDWEAIGSGMKKQAMFSSR